MALKPIADVAIPPADDLSNATNGDETELYFNFGNAWVSAGEITDLPDLPSGEQSTYETTHMKSGKFKEFKKNKRIEGAETEIQGNYSLVDGLATLEQAEESVGSVAYLIVLKEGAKTFYATGRALFYSLRKSNPKDATRQFTITAKWNGPMTISDAAVS